MTQDPSPASARRAGALYLSLTLLGPFSMMYVPSVVFAPGDPEETMARIVASERLFRAGLASDVTIVLVEIVLTAMLFVLLSPFGKELALAATFARATMTVLQAMNLLPMLAALYLAKQAALLHDPEGAASEVRLAFELHALGAHVWEIPFGLHCLLVGVLVYRSRAFPRALGAMMAIAGVGYAADGLGALVVPEAAPALATLVAVTAVVGEVPFVLWLLVRGIRPRGGGHSRAALSGT